jgi:hypothetical protein
VSDLLNEAHFDRRLRLLCVINNFGEFEVYDLSFGPVHFRYPQHAYSQHGDPLERHHAHASHLNALMISRSTVGVKFVDDKGEAWTYTWSSMPA